MQTALDRLTRFLETADDLSLNRMRPFVLARLWDRSVGTSKAESAAIGFAPLAAPPPITSICRRLKIHPMVVAQLLNSKRCLRFKWQVKLRMVPVFQTLHPFKPRMLFFHSIGESDSVTIGQPPHRLTEREDADRYAGSLSSLYPYTWKGDF